MKKYEVTVNVLGKRVCKHVVRALNRDKMAERIGRAYAKEPYKVLMVKELKRMSA